VDQSRNASSWWGHVEQLASDAMEGRKAGTPGHRRAAAYVANQFRTMGLQPAGAKGYFQPVAFRVRQILEDESNLALVRDGKTESLKLGEDAILLLRGESGRTIEADAVFAGYGLTIPEHKIDELSGLDLKNKIVVFISGAPKNVPGALAAHYQSPAERWKRFRAAGAIGLASILNPANTDVPWTRSTLARLQPVLTLQDPALVDSIGQQVGLTVNTASGDKFLAGTGHTMDGLLQAATAGQPLPAFPLRVPIRAKAVFTSSDAQSDNVAAIIPGSDAELKTEYVALTAHLDHLGVGKPINGDGIYNGAMDNASGVASLIEMGKILKDRRLKRSILLIAVTGEEGGLMGSKYFAAHPTVSPRSIVANVNMDMFLPLFPLKTVIAYGMEESTLGPQFSAVARKAAVRVLPDPEPQRRIFIRSDQYSFIRNGVPALAFKFAGEPGSAEERTTKEWLHNRYHAPSDDLKQPVDVEAAAAFTRLLASFAEEVANDPKRLAWNETSFFRRYQ
jgi:Zn-dependent M28 family amino/carboxypeptidase